MRLLHILTILSIVAELANCQILYSLNCNTSGRSLKVGEVLEPIVCTTTANINPRVTPELPAGLTYSIVKETSLVTVTIFGTPIEPINPRLFYIGYNAWVSAIEISIYGEPTYCSYGFDSMTLYKHIIMEPIPIRCNTAIDLFTINPKLPTGMVLNPTSGAITGNLTVSNEEDIVYTVTASNANKGYGSTTTTFTFRARDQNEMTTPGMIGCYWKTITECKTPDFDFFYKNNAQLCQTVGDLSFTDNDVDNTWPGLDRRFVDYYSAYFYSYLNILTKGSYTFWLSSDDGAIFYIDDLDNPFIERESCRALSETEGTITLDKGRHLLVIRFFEYNAWSSLYVKYSSSAAGIVKSTIKSDIMRVGGRGPTFVTYDFISGYVNTDLPISMPQLGSGAPTMWTVTPPLPSGIVIDSGNGYISGVPAETSSGIYTVTAEGVNGKTTATVRIVIANSYQNGFYAKYYKVTDTNLCAYNMLTGNTIQLTSEKIDTQVNFPYSSVNTVWDEFPTTFTNLFYVEWEGYLRMNKIGYWTLRLTCDDGCNLIGANERVIISHWGCHGFTASEAKFAVSTNGYYFFRVEYQQAQNSKGMVFEWKAPDGVWEVVPSSEIFFTPRGVLSYRNTRAHYFKGVPITDNAPILFSVNSLTTYASSPALPGLELNHATGVISGTPTAVQINTQYTISARSGSGTESTVISFDVAELSPPTNILYMNNGATVTPGTTIQLIPLRAMTVLTISNPDGYSVSSYTVTPDLPLGVTLDGTSGVISGTPKQKKDATTYTVTAHNAAGVFHILLSLAVSGCKGVSGENTWTGDFYYVYMYSGANGLIEVQNNGVTTTCSINSMGSDGNAESVTCSTTLYSSGTNMATICINPASTTLSLKMTCYDNAGCRYQVKREDGYYFPPRYAYTDVGYNPYIDTSAWPVTLVPLSAIALASDTLTTYTGTKIENIGVTITGAYKSITIEPLFGDVSVDPTNPVMKGTAKGEGVVVYTVTAVSDTASVFTQLTVTYDICSASTGNRLIVLRKTTKQYGEEESYRFLQGDTVLYSSGRLAAYEEYNKPFCLQPGNYTIEMNDSYGDGWSTDAYLKVYNEIEDELGSFFFTSPGSTVMKQTTKLFELTRTGMESVWYSYIKGKPDSKWNTAGFDHAGWTVAGKGTAGTWEYNGAYFITSFNINGIGYYPIVEFGIYYKDGCIVYLNGNEVYRKNMASGSVSYRTAAISTFDDYYIRLGTAPGYLLREGENVIAVELHRMQNVQGSIYWNSYISYERNECVSRAFSGTITESNFYDKNGETALQAWSKDMTTQWTENGLPAWTVYSYNFDRVEWVNRVVVGSSIDDANRDVAKFTVYGSNNGVNWDYLFSHHDTEMFTTRGQTQDFMMMDHMGSYGKYKFEINKSIWGVAQVSLSFVDIQACRLVYCPKDGDFPGTLRGHTVTIECAEGYIGDRTRACGNEDVKPVWGAADEKECRSKQPNRGYSYIDVAYGFGPVKASGVIEYQATLRSAFAEVLKVDAKTVEVWKIKDISNTYEGVDLGDGAKVAIYVRVTAKEKEAEAVLNNALNSLDPTTAKLHKEYQDVFPSNTLATFYYNVELNEYKGKNNINGWLLTLVIVLCAAIILFVAFYIYTRTKNKKYKNGSRRLARGKQVNASKARL